MTRACPAAHSHANRIALCRGMLREEDLDPATIRALMSQYEADGNWRYQASKRQQRLKLLHTEERITGAHEEGISNEAPKIRTFDVCKWRGTDAKSACPGSRPRLPAECITKSLHPLTDNIFCCNNSVRWSLSE